MHYIKSRGMEWFGCWLPSHFLLPSWTPNTLISSMSFKPHHYSISWCWQIAMTLFFLLLHSWLLFSPFKYLLKDYHSWKNFPFHPFPSYGTLPNLSKGVYIELPVSSITYTQILIMYVFLCLVYYYLSHWPKYNCYHGRDLSFILICVHIS